MKDEVIEILTKVKAIIRDGHFVYVSGKHGSIYLNKDAIYPHTAAASRIGELFAEKHKDLPIDVVVGPALGGIILSQWTAHHLSRLLGKEVFGVYTEKSPDGNQVFTRGYDKLVAGKNILVVEDITTTGGSVQKVITSVKAAGGNVAAVGVMINRSPKVVDSGSIGAPYSALAELPVEDYEESACPFCKAGKPINTDLGHGKKFLASKKS